MFQAKADPVPDLTVNNWKGLFCLELFVLTLATILYIPLIQPLLSDTIFFVYCSAIVVVLCKS